MFEQRVEALLQEKNYRRVPVDAIGLCVYFCERAGVCLVILHYSEKVTERLNREQYESIEMRLRRFFLDEKGYGNQNFLTLVETKEPAGKREMFGEKENVWLLDTNAKRMILYEGQQDFDDLQQSVENALYEQTEESESKAEARKHLALSPCNSVLVLCNVLIFLLCEIFGSTQDTEFLLAHGALNFEKVLAEHEYYRLFTYMFLHGGIEHLLNNMLILWFLGDNLEKQLGHRKYLIAYFASGILAGLVSMSYNSSMDKYAVCVGASGAIFGVVGALAFVVLINRGCVENLTTRQMILFVVLSLYGGFTSQGVDNAAHVGGLIAGVLLGLLLYRRKAGKRETLRHGGKCES